jgi:hypothetical protein
MINKADRQEVISLRWIKRGNYQHPFDRKRNMRKGQSSATRCVRQK